jgi:hypothetical protein
VTAIEDDGGIELTRSEIEKIFARGPLPPGRRGNGTPIEDDGGAVRHVDLDMSREKFSLQDLYPPGRRGNGTPTEDDGGGVMVITTAVASTSAS